MAEYALAVAGAAICGVSLAMQVFDGAMKGYNLLTKIGEMPKDCEHLRTRLQIQQFLFLDYAEHIDILEFDAEKVENAPLILKQQFWTLLAVFGQISDSLENLAQFTNIYKPLHAPSQDQGPSATRLAQSFAAAEDGVTNLFKWEQAAKKREHLRGTDHIRKWIEYASTALTQPGRLKWVIADQQRFEKHLDNLAHYNSFLSGLLQDAQREQLQASIEKTHLQLITLADHTEDLKHLLRAIPAARPEESSSDRGLEDRDSLLRTLAEIKLKNLTRLAEAGGTVQSIEAAAAVELDINKFQIPDDGIPVSGFDFGIHKRSQASWMSGSSQQRVYIEWKPYNAAWNETSDRFEPVAKDVRRIASLVSMLQAAENDSFRAPKCIGYVDLHDLQLRPLQLSKRFAFGLVFGDNSNNSVNKPPMSLYDLMETSAQNGQSVPSLSARMKLAHRVSNSFLYFNTVAWYHKTFRSDAIVFFQTSQQTVLYDEPYISGFEYSRPEHVEGSTTKPPTENEHLLYVHPSYQNPKADTHFERAYDIYALGIVLLEIAYWKPIKLVLQSEFEAYAKSHQRHLLEDAHRRSQIVLRLPRDKDVSNYSSAEKAQLKEVCKALLELPGFQEQHPVEPTSDDAKKCRDILVSGLTSGAGESNKYLSHVQTTMGDRYYDAVKACLQSISDVSASKRDERAISGSADDGVSREQTVKRQALEVQKAFMRDVVDNLAAAASSV